ncbi:hypothetical protein [Halobaculum rubrum]|uniref:hypothetical protein n=1 Tax=Halobaculum rubrum TaxID=2872158 RepID=UPI001CA3F356|nr:hypothetical protein [Halobaculum rubrum]QZX98708.1 hypothetical protein K6T25_10520 [Halobaculum rubrum]
MLERDLEELREERAAARRAFELSLEIDSSGDVAFAEEWFRDVSAEIAAVKGCRARSERLVADGGEPDLDEVEYVAWCDDACGRLGGFRGEPAAETKVKSHRETTGHSAYVLPRHEDGDQR